MPTHNPSRKRLARRLGALFALCLIMGPGPGIYLINPSPGESESLTVFGAPVIYVWAVFWCAVMASTVVIAYCKIWVDEEEAC